MAQNILVAKRLSKNLNLEIDSHFAEFQKDLANKLVDIVLSFCSLFHFMTLVPTALDWKIRTGSHAPDNSTDEDIKGQRTIALDEHTDLIQSIDTSYEGKVYANVSLGKANTLPGESRKRYATRTLTFSRTELESLNNAWPKMVCNLLAVTKSHPNHQHRSKMAIEACEVCDFLTNGPVSFHSLGVHSESLD